MDGVPVGCRVSVVGLRGKPEHNGKAGHVIGRQGGRMQVRLDDGGELALQPANLLPLDATIADERKTVAVRSTDTPSATSRDQDEAAVRVATSKAIPAPRVPRLIRWPAKLVAVAVPLGIMLAAFAIDRLSGDIW